MAALASRKAKQSNAEAISVGTQEHGMVTGLGVSAVGLLCFPLLLLPPLSAMLGAECGDVCPREYACEGRLQGGRMTLGHMGGRVGGERGACLINNQGLIPGVNKQTATSPLTSPGDGSSSYDLYRTNSTLPDIVPGMVWYLYSISVPYQALYQVLMWPRGWPVLQCSCWVLSIGKVLSCSTSCTCHRCCGDVSRLV